MPRAMFFVLIAFGELFPATSVLQASTIYNEMNVNVAEGLVSVQAKRVPLQSVLSEVAKQAGFQLFINGELPMVESQNLNDLPIEDALRRLIGDQAFVAIYDEGKQPRKLCVVRIYSDMRSEPAGSKVDQPRSRVEDTIPLENTNLQQLTFGSSFVPLPALESLQRYQHPQGSQLVKDPWGAFVPSSGVAQQGRKLQSQRFKPPSTFLGDRIWRDPSSSMKAAGSSDE